MVDTTSFFLGPFFLLSTVQLDQVSPTRSMNVCKGLPPFVLIVPTFTVLFRLHLRGAFSGALDFCIFSACGPVHARSGPFYSFFFPLTFLFVGFCIYACIPDTPFRGFIPLLAW